MIDDADIDGGGFDNVETVDAFPGLHQAKKVKHAIKDANVGIRRDHGSAVDAAHGVALRPKRVHVDARARRQPAPAGDEPQIASAFRFSADRRRRAQQAVEPAFEFGDGESDRLACIVRNNDLLHRSLVWPGLAALHRRIAQPEIVAVLGARGAEQTENGKNKG